MMLTQFCLLLLCIIKAQSLELSEELVGQTHHSHSVYNHALVLGFEENKRQVNEAFETFSIIKNNPSSGHVQNENIYEPPPLLEEGVPVRDSINYNSTLSFRFQPELKTEWTHSYQILVYLSGSLCQIPESINQTSSFNGLTLYYTFNETDMTESNIQSMKRVPFSNGYVEALAEISIETNSNYTLYMIVIPDQCSTCTEDSTWVFEFAASQKNLIFLYDTEPIISVVDADYNSAIFEAEEIVFGENRSFEMYIFKDTYPLPTALNQSLCAITSTTDFSMRIGINESSAEGIYNYFLVENLEMAQRYSAVLIETNSALEYGGGIFQPFNFTTSKTKACKLIYNLDFCDEVSYSVPISKNFYNGEETWDQLVAAYDNYTESLYVPFEYAMQQIPCDTELDARYSPIRTCADCMYSYKQWLCAVSIPRCVSTSAADSQNKLYGPGEGRNAFIENTINPPLPYAEVLPCLNVCQSIVRDCPPVFEFMCPETASLAKLSYGDANDFDTDYDSSNFTEGSLVYSTTDSDNAVHTYRKCNFLGDKNILNYTAL